MTPVASSELYRTYLRQLNLTTPGLARLMIERGDNRSLATIRRQLFRLASGATTMSGELRVVLEGFLREQRESSYVR